MNGGRSDFYEKLYEVHGMLKAEGAVREAIDRRIVEVEIRSDENRERLIKIEEWKKGANARLRRHEDEINTIGSDISEITTKMATREAIDASGSASGRHDLEMEEVKSKREIMKFVFHLLEKFGPYIALGGYGAYETMKAGGG